MNYYGKDYYNGEWKNDGKDGKGVLICASGNKYEDNDHNHYN